MDTKKLRQKILDLAIRGKLVPQDPNDEPASVLLERIRAEKERLIKEGKIKRSKKTAEDETEAPFEIPESWEWIRFGEYLDVRDGTHDTPKYVENGYPFVTSKNLSNGRIDFTNVNYISESDHFLFSKRSFVEDGDILFAMIGSIGNPVLVKKDREFSIKNVALFKPFDRNNTDMLFVYFFLCYFQNELKNKSKGGMQPFIPLNLFRNDILIPIPPTREQNRITSEIERWFSVIDELESNEDDLLKAIDKAKSKILDLAIHGKLVPQDPNDEPAIELLKRINPKFEPCDEVNHIPDNWINCRIQDVFKIAMGSSPTGESLNRNGDGIEFHQGKLSFTELYLGLSDIYTTQSVKLASPNSILLCVRAPVGVVNITEREVCIGRGLCSLAPMNAINLMYGLYVLQTCQKDFEQKATGSTFKAIGGDVIKNHIIPLPPYNEQLRIVSKIEEAFKALDALS